MVDMIVPLPQDVIHKAWLYRLLSAIYDEADLAQVLNFKGGTCAAMLGYLDRFSVDLDFDYVGNKQSLFECRKKLETVFSDLGLVIHNQSKVVPQYFLKYDAQKNTRNTMKIDVTTLVPKANQYEPQRLHEIDRIIRCQTKETMMANKLVALTDRFEKNGTIAGRDIYDIHHFFLKGFRCNEGVIKERTGKSLPQFFTNLIEFIKKHITEEVINQDLNMLLTPKQFTRIRKIIKQETIMLLQDELVRLKK